MVNRYPLWKNLLLVVITLLGLLYAAPNLFGEDPALQISAGNSSNSITTDTLVSVTNSLKKAQLNYLSTQLGDKQLLIRFRDADTQLKAAEVVKVALGDDYTVALNLAPATPKWLRKIGAEPAKLGLDLRGGVHFLLDVDTHSVIKERQTGNLKTARDLLHDNNIHYLTLDQQANGDLILQFNDSTSLEDAKTLLRRQLRDLEWSEQNKAGNNYLAGKLTQAAIQQIKQYTLEQTMTTLRNRVNELGVTEALVQQQGADRVSVDLPGILDTARAKQILGGTATLEFRLADQTHDPRSALNGPAPAGTILYTYNEMPVLLQDRIILTGNSITDAMASFGEDGRPSVSISLGGGGEATFHRVTSENIGRPLAIVYVETKFDTQQVNGQLIKIPRKTERVISIATIQTALGNHFQITGLTNPEVARDLALLLRAGALVAPISIAEERVVGPQLGMDNIHKGIVSVIVGISLVALFMLAYYRLFGLIADLALVLNMILLLALLSLLGATLTLPGIAGIVLTVGMAVDANVLIFERIREEFRNNATPQASIHAGYERAYSTIVDANVTTLIVALVLFGLGTGPIKGFAVTLSLGILTSMLTGIMFTRAVVNAIYGKRHVKRLAIGI
jgi:preprotein translocase subunit SecD